MSELGNCAVMKTHSIVTVIDSPVKALCRILDSCRYLSQLVLITVNVMLFWTLFGVDLFCIVMAIGLDEHADDRRNKTQLRLSFKGSFFFSGHDPTKICTDLM